MILVGLHILSPNDDAGGVSDGRGQSQVLDAILVFGFLIAGLGLVQAFVVPQQNEQVELNHAGEVQEDFNDVYTGVMNAAETGSSRSASIKLGTRYPAREFMINPSAPTGTIRTKDLNSLQGQVQDDTAAGTPIYNIENDVCGLNDDTQTKALIYEPNYNFANNIGKFGYHQSANYQSVNPRQGNPAAVKTNQQLINGNTISLRPIVNGEVSKGSTDSETLTFTPGSTGDTTIESTNQVVLTIPTDLTAEQWETILSSESNFVKTDDAGAGYVEITLKADEYRVECTPIGLNDRPANIPTVNDDGDDSSTDSPINPVGGDNLVLKSTSGSGSKLSATFKNNDMGDSKRVDRVRVPYVVSPGNGNQVKVEGTTNPPNAGKISTQVGTGYINIPDSSLEDDWTWDPNGQRTVQFTGKAIKKNTGVAVEFEFKDGNTTTYFVSDG